MVIAELNESNVVSLAHAAAVPITVDVIELSASSEFNTIFVCTIRLVFRPV